MYMKFLDWSEEKNQKLQQERSISFERVQLALEEGRLLTVIEHHNSKYQHQKIMVVDINEYIYLVPFVEDEEKLFLKTIIPSRKATKEYLSTKKKK